MTVRNLEAMFQPRRVAVVGASDRPGRVGTTVWRNLNGHFQGERMAFNPRRPDLGAPVVASVAERPAAPDLAVICTPPASVPGLIGELGARGCRAAVVITAGFSGAQKRAMLQAARPLTLRILGPKASACWCPTRASTPALHTPAPRPATSPSCRSRGRWSPPCWTGPTTAASAFRTSSHSASTPMSTSATCWTTWPATRARARS